VLEILQFDFQHRDTPAPPQPKTSVFAALPRSLRKASGFPLSYLLFEALPRRRSRRLSKGAHGKAKPFRKESGKAAVRKNLRKKQEGVCLLHTENAETQRKKTRVSQIKVCATDWKSEIL
jgi:hypothetical protein